MRTRITVIDNANRVEGLRLAAKVRKTLEKIISVEIDPENFLPGVHRDEQSRAYFEFKTQNSDQVAKVLINNGYTSCVEVKEVREPVGQGCQNCGNVVGPTLPTICPNCGFRDISACPVCHTEVSRQNYQRIDSNLFHCPQCHSQVRLRFNEPMFFGDGMYNQPLVVVIQE